MSVSEKEIKKSIPNETLKPKSYKTFKEHLISEGCIYSVDFSTLFISEWKFLADNPYHSAYIFVSSNTKHATGIVKSLLNISIAEREETDLGIVFSSKLQALQYVAAQMDKRREAFRLLNSI